MSDASALFAKKGKKKKFKSFNANNLSADALTKVVNVDDVSNDKKVDVVKDETENDKEAWGEIVTKPVKKAVVADSTVTLSSMKSMAEIQKERAEQDDLAEKMRLAEIKEKLDQAKAKVSENDLEKAKEDKEIADGWKKVEEKPKAAPASGIGGGSGKYVPKFRRNGGEGGGTSMESAYQAPGAGGGYGGSRYGSSSAGPSLAAAGSRFQRKVDTKDASAFPTLGGPAPTAKASAPAGAWGSAAAAAGEDKRKDPEESVFEFAK